MTKVFFSQGENFVNKETWRDPYVTYRRNETSVFPMRPNSERAIWRNFCDIVDLRGGASQFLTLYPSTHDSDAAELLLYGVETNRASYLATYRHDLRFPLSIAEDENCGQLLRRGITDCEELAKALGNSLATISELKGSSASQAVQQFYRDCENSFWILCDMVGSQGPEKTLYLEFLDEVSAIAVRKFTVTVSGARLRARALAEAEKGRDVLMRRIRKLKKEARM